MRSLILLQYAIHHPVCSRLLQNNPFLSIFYFPLIFADVEPDGPSQQLPRIQERVEEALFTGASGQDNQGDAKLQRGVAGRRPLDRLHEESRQLSHHASRLQQVSDRARRGYRQVDPIRSECEADLAVDVVLHTEL